MTKKVLKYITLFTTVFVVCLGLLATTSKIPKSAIQNNIKESAEYYKKVNGIEYIRKWREYTYIHYYADSILLNIIYSVDTAHPLSSVLKANFYEHIKQDVNTDFIEMVENGYEPNTEYLRYWHGSMSIIRPLLTFLNIWQIYILNGVTMLLLIIFLTILLFKRNKVLAVTFLVGLVGITIIFVPMCLEYTWTVLVSLVFSIIALLIEKKKPNLLYPMFMVSGMLACYLDFLSTETLTLTLPLILVLCVRYKDGRIKNFKQGFKFLTIATILWIVGYAGMWFAKWFLASFVLGINSFDYVTEKAMIRVNEPVNRYEGFELMIQAVLRNLRIIFPLPNFRNYMDIILILIPIVVLLIHIIVVDIKKIKKLWFSLLMLLVGVIPIIRFMILANHAYRHCFFTFRALLVTIMAIIIICVNTVVAKRDSLNKENFKKFCNKQVNLCIWRKKQKQN